jgi:hypothetical protein
VSTTPSDDSPVRWYPILVAAAAVGIANSVIFSLLSNSKTSTGSATRASSHRVGFRRRLVGQVLLALSADRGHSNAC